MVHALVFFVTSSLFGNLSLITGGQFIDILRYISMYTLCTNEYITANYNLHHCNVHVFLTQCCETENLNLKRRKKVIHQDAAAVYKESEPVVLPGYLSASVLPFVLHLGFMAGTAFFIMHVQVSVNIIVSLVISASTFHVIRSENEKYQKFLVDVFLSLDFNCHFQPRS